MDYTSAHSDYRNKTSLFLNVKDVLYINQLENAFNPHAVLISNVIFQIYRASNFSYQYFNSENVFYLTGVRNQQFCILLLKSKYTWIP